MSDPRPDIESSEVSDEGLSEYYRQNLDREARPELSEALSAVQENFPDLSVVRAVDIGAGTMVESKALLQAGIGHVLATDTSRSAERLALDVSLRHSDQAIDRFEFSATPHQALPDILKADSAELIISYYSLSFMNPDDFKSTWNGLTRALAPGGIVSVSLFGENDDSKEREAGMTFLSRAEINEMVAGLEEIRLDDIEQDRLDSRGNPYHSHVFSLVYRKPVSSETM